MLAVGLCFLLGGRNSHGSPYEFHLLRTSSQIDVTSASMNDNGAVAFWDGLSLYRAQGDVAEQLFTVASTAEKFVYNVTAIDPSGNVAFYARPSLVTALYRTGPGGLRVIASANIQQWSYASISINSQSAVAYEIDPVVGGSWQTWVSMPNGATTVGVPGNSRGSQINDRGEIVYVASGSRWSVMMMAGGQSRFIRESVEESWRYVPAVNNGGVVAAFSDTRKLYVGDGLAMHTVFDCSQFYALGAGDSTNVGSIDINDVGGLAFQAVTRDESGGFSRGIYNGPDPVGDKVVAAGDTLFGKNLTSVSFARGGLNNAGQIAFVGSFSDGTRGVIVASPVPEPSSACLAVAAIAAVILLRRRRRSNRSTAGPHRGRDLFLGAPDARTPANDAA